MKAPPNILFLFSDQHRPDWLGHRSDLPLRTPNLDRLARDGVRFTRAVTPSPLCSPARACLATGHDYRRCGVRNNRQNTPLELPTYYASLRNAGYEVWGVGKFDLHKPDHDWGLNGFNLLREYGFSGGIDCEGKGDAISSYTRNGMSPRGPYMQFLKERGLDETHMAMYAPHRAQQTGRLNFHAVSELPEDAYCDNWIAASAMRTLQDLPAGKPWHLVVNFTGPHMPFDVTPAMRARWQDVKLPPPVGCRETDGQETMIKRQNYAAMIENIDAHACRLIALVAQRGELENTLIVYASDHGEMLGDHDRWGKSVWYTPSTGVPLIVSGPGIRRGAESDALVALHDLAATFLEFAGAEPLPESDARSLRPLLEGRTTRHRDHVFSALEEWSMVRDERYKLVLGAEAGPILHDLHQDPDELHNVANRHPQIVAQLSDQIETKGWAEQEP